MRDKGHLQRQWVNGTKHQVHWSDFDMKVAYVQEGNLSRDVLHIRDDLYVKLVEYFLSVLSLGRFFEELV